MSEWWRRDPSIVKKLEKMLPRPNQVTSVIQEGDRLIVTYIFGRKEYKTDIPAYSYRGGKNDKKDSIIQS